MSSENQNVHSEFYLEEYFDEIYKEFEGQFGAPSRVALVGSLFPCINPAEVYGDCFVKLVRCLTGKHIIISAQPEEHKIAFIGISSHSENTPIVNKLKNCQNNIIVNKYYFENSRIKDKNTFAAKVGYYTSGYANLDIVTDIVEFPFCHKKCR